MQVLFCKEAETRVLVVVIRKAKGFEIFKTHILLYAMDVIKAIKWAEHWKIKDLV